MHAGQRHRARRPPALQHPSLLRSLCSLAALGGWALATLTLRSPAGAQAPALWPELPTDPAAATALVRAQTRRSVPSASASAAPSPSAELSPDELLTLLRRGLRSATLVAGWPGVLTHIGRRIARGRAAGRGTWILWGTHHDSAAQVRAFRRLVGPLGLGPQVSAAAAEAFAARGRWRGVPDGDQAGDSAALAAYLTAGGQQAFTALLQGQRAGNHTAVKYGYVDALLDLAITARASGTRLLGCDAPAPLQARLDALSSDQRLRLRELHCTLALQDGLQGQPGPWLVATLWGQAHVEADGMQRFLPAGDTVVALRVLGGRASRSCPEALLGGRLALTDPVLVPRARPGAVDLLLLPAGGLGATVERTHTPLEGAAAEPLPGQVTLSSAVPGALELVAIPAGPAAPAGDPLTRVHQRLSGAPVVVSLPPGDYVYALDTGKAMLVGAARLPRDGALELDLRPAERHVDLIIHDPSADLRAVLGVRRAVERAMEQRDVKTLLGLVSPAYSDAAGTETPHDDITASVLPGVLQSTLGSARRVEVDTTLRSVSVQGDRATLVYEYRARYLMGQSSEERWISTDDLATLRLRREPSGWRVTSGL